MKVVMEFIDQKGFWHVAQADSKRKAVESLKVLHPQTLITWLTKNKVLVSQQYIKGGKR